VQYSKGEREFTLSRGGGAWPPTVDGKKTWGVVECSHSSTTAEPTVASAIIAMIIAVMVIIILIISLIIIIIIIIMRKY
jgi:hypothetical protein